MNREELFKIKTDKPNDSIYTAAKKRFDSLAKPVDGLGEFEDIICRIASIQGREVPDISKKALIIMCADNGVCAEGVSQTEPAVTFEVASLMAGGKSTVGAMIAGSYKGGSSPGMVDIIPIDIGIASDEKVRGLIDRRVAKGTGNIVKEPAMTEEECLRAIEAGIDAVRHCHENGVGLIATGEMGIGNTTTSTAVYCALTGTDPADVTGRGAGLDDAGLARKTQVIKKALEHHDFNNNIRNITSPQDLALSALAKLGGLDIAGLAGVYIGGALYDTPVIIDGAITAVAAFCASRLVPDTRGYMISSHTGKERITGAVLDMLGLKSVINAGLALGEGTGAVMMFPLLDMVMNVYRNGTRFSDTQIKQYERFTGC